MSHKFIIRPPQSTQEWNTVRRLLLEYRDEFDDKTCFTSFEEEMDHIEELYAKPDKVKLIAVDPETNTIAGCVAYRTFSPGVAEMKRLYVEPSYRGHQLGRLLAEHIINEAERNGFESMILDTMMEMKAAQALYLQLDFEVIPSYNGQNPTKVICYKRTIATL